MKFSTDVQAVLVFVRWNLICASCIMSPPQQLGCAQKEARIQLAKGAIEKGQIRRNRHAAKMYDAVETTLRRRRAGIRSRGAIVPPTQGYLRI